MQSVVLAGSGEDAAEGLEHLGFYVAAQLDVPLAVVDRGFVLVWANQAARSRHDSAWTTLFEADTQHCADVELRRKLQALVLACLRSQSGSEALVEGQDGIWFATASPLKPSSSLALLRLVAMHQLGAGIRERLRRLFGLTKAEAHITAQLATGWSLECIAEARGVSVDTVRAQVRSVFQKTGTHRQGELICTVGKLAAE